MVSNERKKVGIADISPEFGMSGLALVMGLALHREGTTSISGTVNKLAFVTRLSPRLVGKTGEVELRCTLTPTEAVFKELALANNARRLLECGTEDVGKPIAFPIFTGGDMIHIGMALVLTVVLVPAPGSTKGIIANLVSGCGGRCASEYIICLLCYAIY